MQRIQRTATAMVPLLWVFAVLYVYFTAGGDLRWAFLDRELWYQSYWVHPEAPSPNGQRALYLAIWMLPIAFGLFAVACALRLLRRIQQGTLFDADISRWLRLLGIGTSGSGVADFVGNLVTPQVMSWNNPDGPVPFQWYFDSEPAGLIVCGGGFYLIGWIMAEACRIADENEGFI